MPQEKKCSACRLTKPLANFYTNKAYKAGYDARCISCISPTSGRWPAASYIAVQRFSAAEQYMVNKLAAKPTLAAALDGLYRKNPKRWHQVVVAATLQREQRA